MSASNFAPLTRQMAFVPDGNEVLYSQSVPDEPLPPPPPPIARPFMSLVIFGWSVIELTREAYERLPPTLRSAADSCFVAEKKD